MSKTIADPLLLSRPSGTLSSISEMEERDGERRRFCSAVNGQGGERRWAGIT
jgi:hypothetical protein